MSITVAPNSVVQLLCTFTSTPEGQADPAVDWDLTGATDSRTSISNEGVLKVGPGELGPLIVIADWVNDDWTVGTQTVAVEIEPAGVPYWPQEPGTGPTPPEPATLAMTVTDSTTEEEVTGDTLTKGVIYTVVLASSDLPDDAAVTLVSSSEMVQLRKVVVVEGAVAYQLSVHPNTETDATVKLTGSATGRDSVVKEYTVAAAG